MEAPISQTVPIGFKFVLYQKRPSHQFLHRISKAPVQEGQLTELRRSPFTLEIQLAHIFI